MGSVHNGETICIVDSPQDFAAQCLALLKHREAREKIAEDGLALIRAKFSWQQVTRSFEQALLEAREPVAPTA